MQPATAIDWPSALTRLNLPTLVLHGELDVIAQTESMQYLTSLIPNSRMVVFEGSGHIPAMTRPNDVAREVDTFLRRLPD